MSISKEINIDVLNEVYALSAFHGLRASHPDDQWNHQMVEEAEGYLPNSDVHVHGDVTTHDHFKSNPALEAMQRAVETTDPSHHVSTNGDKNPNSLNASDHITTPLNKSNEDLTNLHEYVD